MKALLFALALAVTTAVGAPLGSHKTFVLSSGIYFDPTSTRYYQLEVALDTARSGDVIEIVLDHNYGGYVGTMADIIERMRSSHATVVTRVEGFATSAAMYIYLAGDQIIVKKHVFLGIDHLPYLPGHQRPDEYAAYWIKYIQYHKKFLTPREFDAVIHKQDVPIYGSSVCARPLPHLRDTPSECVIRQAR